MSNPARAPIEVNRTIPADTALRFGQKVGRERWLSLAEAIGSSSLQGYVGIRDGSSVDRFPRVPDAGSNPPVDYDDPTTNAISTEPRAEPIVFSNTVGDARYVLAARAEPGDLVEMFIRNTDGAASHDARMRIGTGTSLSVIGGERHGP